MSAPPALGSYLSGRWVEGGGRVHTLVNPATEEPLAQVRSGGQDLRGALDFARGYIEAGVLPKARDADALHVAAATNLEFDYLVSWNHRHMTRPMKRLLRRSPH